MGGSAAPRIEELNGCSRNLLKLAEPSISLKSK